MSASVNWLAELLAHSKRVFEKNPELLFSRSSHAAAFCWRGGKLVGESADVVEDVGLNCRDRRLVDDGLACSGAEQSVGPDEQAAIEFADQHRLVVRHRLFLLAKGSDLSLRESRGRSMSAGPSSFDFSASADPAKVSDPAPSSVSQPDAEAFACPETLVPEPGKVFPKTGKEIVRS